MTKRTFKAFTMIELLIVMAIIGFLIAVAIWGISIAQQNARNVQREEKGGQLLVAMSEFYSRYSMQPSSFELVTDATGVVNIRLRDATGTKYYDTPMDGVTLPDPGWVSWHGDSATIDPAPPVGFHTSTVRTHYSIGSTSNGYRICVGLEGGSPGYQNLSEKPNIVTCP